MKHLALIITSVALFAACSSAPSATPPTYIDMSSSSPTDTMSSSTASDTSTTNTQQWDGTLLKGKHTVVLKTNKGDITIELDADLASKTVTNFVTLAKNGYYDNITFHRVIPGFMIQGGDPSGNGTGGKSIFGEMFEDEIDVKNAVYTGGYKAGTIAMANRGPNTNGSQFFIMDADYPLPPSYTIFGYVTKGQEVVNTIARVPRDQNDMPNDKVTFNVIVSN
jgi:cyclophilin family peptidyl-prolyl cis-trans isomerase